MHNNTIFDSNQDMTQLPHILSKTIIPHAILYQRFPFDHL